MKDVLQGHSFQMRSTVAFGKPRRLCHDTTARGGVTPGWHAHPVEDIDGEL